MAFHLRGGGRLLSGAVRPSAHLSVPFGPIGPIKESRRNFKFSRNILPRACNWKICFGAERLKLLQCWMGFNVWLQDFPETTQQQKSWLSLSECVRRVVTSWLSSQRYNQIQSSSTVMAVYCDDHYDTDRLVCNHTVQFFSKSVWPNTKSQTRRKA